jgi:hypothetical protein
VSEELKHSRGGFFSFFLFFFLLEKAGELISDDETCLVVFALHRIPDEVSRIPQVIPLTHPFFQNPKVQKLFFFPVSLFSALKPN